MNRKLLCILLGLALNLGNAALLGANAEPLDAKCSTPTKQRPTTNGSIPGTSNVTKPPETLTPQQLADYLQEVTPEDSEEVGVACFETHAYAGALKMLQHAAMMGRPKAQFYLARMYEEGDGVPKNEAEAARWFQKAVRRRYLPAYDALGRLYRMGTGVQKNPTEAAKLFRAAAEQGDAEAQASLGNCTEFGDGVEQMNREAEVWYQRSAEQGCARGQCFFGELLSRQAAEVFRARIHDDLMFGLPIPTELESELFIEADKWHLLAARQGFVPLHQRDYPIDNTNSWILYSKEEQKNFVEALRRADAFIPHKEQFADTARNSEPAGVLDGPVSSGSAFFISEDGYLLTNFHVVDDAMNIMVQHGRETYPATLVKIDQINDLALLKIAGRFRALPISSSCASKLGDSVFTIGFPNPKLQGTEPKLTDGRISSLAGFQDDSRNFQISVAVQPGNSGGALVNSLGNVVGIVAARLSDRAALETSGALPQNVNYAIKSSYVLSLLESVPEISGKLAKPSTAKERKYEDVVKEAQEAAALILVY